MAPPLSPLPSLDQLPLREGDPPNSAWGLWGDGPASALGSLNYLDEELVSRTAREEIRTGERVGLKCELPSPPHQCLDVQSACANMAPASRSTFSTHLSSGGRDSNRRLWTRTPSS